MTEFKKRAIPLATRRAVALAAGCLPGVERHPATCHYCGAPGLISWFKLYSGRPGAWVHFTDLELDHVIPEHTGGPSDPGNIVLACRTCNRRKGRRTPDEWQKAMGET